MKIGILLISITCLLIIITSQVVLVEREPEEHHKVLKWSELNKLQTTTEETPSQWSPYWCVIQVPQHSYQLHIGENIITLNITYETSYSTISAFGYYGDYENAKKDGIIGWICEYDGSGHFPEPTRTFIPGHTYVVEAYQPCYWGFPNEDNCRKR